jgi:hypothetical protein
MKTPGQKLGLCVLGRYEHFEVMGEKEGDLMRVVVVRCPVEYLFAQSTRWLASYGETRVEAGIRILKWMCLIGRQDIPPQH